MLKYMTADLVNRMQYEDEEAVRQVDEEWEANLALYDKRLEEIKPRLPESVRKFLDLMCLHDADWVASSSMSVGKAPLMPELAAGDTLILAIVQRDWGDDKYACNLGYRVESVSVRDNEGPGFNPAGPVIWLYDEFDIDDEGKYVHNVLFSSGLELEIKFQEMHWFKAPITEDWDF
jgi:hypothetical protein